MLSNGYSSDIILNVNAHEPRQREESGLDKRKQEESGAVDTKLNLKLFTKITPCKGAGKKSAKALITVSPSGDIRITVKALESAPNEIQKRVDADRRIRAEVFVNKKRNIIVIRPSDDISTSFTFRNTRASKTLSVRIKRISSILGISESTRYQAAWDPELQAWVGRREEI